MPENRLHTIEIRCGRYLGRRGENGCRKPPERPNLGGAFTNGPPGMAASDRTSRHCDTTHASAAGDSPAPARPPNRRRLHPGDAQHEGVKGGLQLREQGDDRTGNRGKHVLNERDDVKNRRDQIGNRRTPAMPNRKE